MARLRKRKWFGLLFLVALLGSGLLVLGNLPFLVDAMPGQIRGRLPENVLSLITTPLPTALPAPAIMLAEPSYVPIPTLSRPTATKEAQLGGHGDASATAARRATPYTTENQSTRISTPTPTVTPAPTQHPLPRAMNIVGPQVVPQQFNNCGPANLSIVLNYFGHATDQQSIGQALKPNYDDRNVSPHELAGFVNNDTPLRAEVYRGGDAVLLRQFLAAGIPVIIEKGLLLSREQGWMGHYLTLVGYRDSGEQFYALDTFLGPWDSSGKVYDYDTLEQLWAQFNHTFILVYPIEDQQTVSAILGQDLTDPILMWQSAALTAQQSLESDAENAFAWFNLGASLTHLGELTGHDDYFDNAALAFDRARQIGLPWRMLWYQFEPYVAYLAVGRLDDVRVLSGAILSDSGGRDVEESHLYQGHALLAAGDAVGAERSYRRALTLNPNYEEAKLALASLP